MNFYESLMWFFGGALFYKVFSYLLALGNAYVLFTHIETLTLNMLKAASSDIEASFEIKHKHLKATGVKEERLKVMRTTDSATLVLWRDAVIANLINSMPKYFHKFVQYTNWSEAQAVLKQRVEDSKDERNQS